MEQGGNLTIGILCGLLIALAVGAMIVLKFKGKTF
jgi:hypothetical protein